MTVHGPALNISEDRCLSDGNLIHDKIAIEELTFLRQGKLPGTQDRFSSAHFIQHWWKNSADEYRSSSI